MSEIPPPLTPAPPPPSGAKPPFARTAAQFSAWSPLIAIGINMITGFGAAVMVLGVILGIVALCGVPRHGRKGILVPAILGITINVALFVLAFVAVQKVAEKARAVKAQAEQQQHAR